MSSSEMSPERSNSAVRNLRSIFENRASESTPSARGRSPGSLGGDLDPQRTRSKVRSSFIPVEPTMSALAAEQINDGEELSRKSSAGVRRASFSESRSEDALKEMKDTMEAEQERRRESSVAEAIPELAIESAGPTPAIEVMKELGSAAAPASAASAAPEVPAAPEPQKEDKEAANPDKPVTGAEEEPVNMKPADPASESAVSGGEALPPVAEDLRKTTSKPTKPSSISTKTVKAAQAPIKSPGQPKTPVSTSSADPSKKPSRSSLTAPTAASVARQAAADKQAAAAAKPKSREATKPLEVSSRLTAPTAASRARLESATSAPVQAPKPGASAKGKPAASSRSTPRTSFAGLPDSRLSHKPAAPVDGNFLERMTRPTAASTSRAHEKTEVKSPPKQKQLPLRPKTNGTTKPKPSGSTAAGTSTEPENDATVVEDASILPDNGQLQVEEAADAGAAEPASVEKALERTSKDEPNGHVENTPAVENVPSSQAEEEAVQ